MKNMSKQNQITLAVIVGSFALYTLISFASTPLTKSEGEPVKKVVVETKDVSLFDAEGVAKAPENNRKTLNYSFSFPSTVVRETKYDGRTVHFYFDSRRVASLSFVSNENTRYTPFSYAKDILGQRIPVAIDTNEMKIGKYSYIAVGAEASYFRITSVKNKEWLASLEVLEDNQALEKVILESLSFK